MDIEQLARQLSISFNDHQLIEQAFRHSSYVNEHRQPSYLNNERLEFLGDAVLELVVSQYLYRKFPKKSEGELSKLRASIVREDSLVHFAEQLQLGNYIMLGKGEESTGGRSRPSLLADVFESLLGALFLDQGYERVESFIEEDILPLYSDGAFSHTMDYKSELQERVQRFEHQVITYEIVHEAGPAHDKNFIAEVHVNNHVFRGDAGRSKKEAEQRAAKKALDTFDQQKLYL